MRREAARLAGSSAKILWIADLKIGSVQGTKQFLERPTTNQSTAALFYEQPRADELISIVGVAPA